jgi:hypothetical protein
MNFKVAPLVITFLAVAAPALSIGQGNNNSSNGNSPSGSSSASLSSSPSTPSAPSPPTGPSSSGTFSIEAEIFGYKSLQSDSEAIACDLAAFLYPGEIISARPYGKNKLLTPPDWTDEDARRYEPRPDACKFKNEQEPKTSAKSVIILPSTSTAVANYQVWRLNMIIMHVYLQEAASFDCSASKAQRSGGMKMQFDTSDVGQAISVFQSALQLFANSEAALEVSGTIQDQALVDGIGRELRNMNVPVLVPDLYTSFSFSGTDYSESPFLARLGQLIAQRNCLQGKLNATADTMETTNLTAQRDAYLRAWSDGLDKITDPKTTTAERKELKLEEDDLLSDIKNLNDMISGSKAAASQATISGIQSLTASIDAFVATLAGASPSSQPTSAGPTSASAPSAPGAPSSGSPAAPSPTSPAAPSAASPTPAATPAPSTGAPPPIVSALAADGLARKLSTNPDTDVPDDSKWRVLAVKALESGGALITQINILGSKLYFSGGAVATYALFSFDGTLACSGNVFDYGGYVRASQFAQRFRRADIEPNKQLIFLRGGCAPPTAVAAIPPSR